MICIAVRDDLPLDWPELVNFLSANMPHYMVPRYYRRMVDLPKTETGKVRKELLREHGVTDDTWDREAAGLVIKGVRVG